MTATSAMGPSARTASDIAIVGGGLSGTLAAYLLGRAGHTVTLIDRHRTFPARFRAEKLNGEHIAALQRFGLSLALSARGVAFDTVINLQHGRIVDRTHSSHQGILYHDLVEAIRAEWPETVRLVVGQANGLKTGPRRQRVAVLGQEEVTARFLVLATGAGDTLRRDLAIARRVLRPRHSLAFGFNLRLSEAHRFPRAGVNLAGVTCYGDGITDGVDYLTLFPVAGALRANLFAYRDYDASWVKALRERPDDTLAAAFPHLSDTIGAFAVEGRIDSWSTDIAVADNVRQDGLVLIGDVFQTSCPAAGLGVSRLLTDVERLCRHVPGWLREGTFSAKDISAFYDDPEKQAMDGLCLIMADFRRGLTTGTDISSRVARQLHFTRRHAMHVIDTVSPALAARLRDIRNGQGQRTPPFLAPDRG